MKIRIIITGATGMVGEGVLLECLRNPDVEKVLSLSRRPCGIEHSKLTEIIHDDFLNIMPVAGKLSGYDACFFCLGISSLGISKEEYFRTTYTLTLHVAAVLSDLNPGMTFCYISGAGTDSTEKGKLNWARVKGKVENELLKFPFRKVFNFRPAFIMPSGEQKHVHGYYLIFRMLYPVFRVVMPSFVSTMKELATAMINSVIYGYEKPILEVNDIKKLSNR
jgi:nucleoside-diphosphate-sugar epimerase